MKQVSRFVLVFLVILLVVVLVFGQIIFLERGRIQPTAGQATGGTSVCIYAATPEANYTSTFSTSSGSATIDVSGESVAMYLEIETSADVINKTLNLWRYDRNFKNVNVSNKTSLRMYLICSPSSLNTYLSEVTLRFYYTNAELSASGLSESRLDGYKWNGTGWDILTSSSVNTALNYVEGTTTSFGEGVFAIFEGPADEVTPPPPGGGGAGGGGVADEEVEEELVTIEEVEEIARKIVKYATPSRENWPMLIIYTIIIIAIGLQLYFRYNNKR